MQWIPTHFHYPLHCAWRTRQPELQGDNPMDYAIPCNPCTSIYQKPTLNRQTTCPKSFALRSNVTKWRMKTTSELQTPVGVTDRAGSYSPSIPTHKVTVHDRQRGVVHQFLVPEVTVQVLTLCFFLCLLRKSHRNSIHFPKKINGCWNFRTSTYCTLLSLRTSLFHSLAGTVLFAFIIFEQ